jgi:hypothetical protein
MRRRFTACKALPCLRILYDFFARLEQRRQIAIIESLQQEQRNWRDISHRFCLFQDSAARSRRWDSTPGACSPSDFACHSARPRIFLQPKLLIPYNCRALEASVTRVSA